MADEETTAQLIVGAVCSYILERKPEATEAEILSIAGRWSIEGWQAVSHLMLGKSVSGFEAQEALDILRARAS